MEGILFEDPTVCIHCGRAGAGPDSLCADCRDFFDKTSSRHVLSEDPFFVAYSAGFYNNFLKEAFAAYKFRGKSYWAPAFEGMLEEYVHGHPLLSKARWISYIPMRRSREIRRGYNPSKEMACFVSKKEGIVLLDSLRKVRRTLEQNKLSGRARRKNVEGAFEVKERDGRISGKIWKEDQGKWISGKVPMERLQQTKGILVDDFLTTGNTMKEGLETLFEAGIPAWGLTLASVSYPKEDEKEKGRSDEDCIGRTLNDFKRDGWKI